MEELSNSKKKGVSVTANDVQCALCFLHVAVAKPFRLKELDP